MSGCPEEATLERYHAGLLDGDRAHEVRTHAARCATCTAWLAAAAADDAVLDELRPALAAEAAQAEPPASGQRIDEFRIVRQLGAGGMGVVFEAEQEHPRRRVALKLIRSGLSSARALQRFALEAELLGRLQHPGIAKILKAGTVPDPGGPQPFFAMELVTGRPLHEHAAGLARDAKVRLLIALCDAVHHAHQHGIVHRDLKPDNILVGADGRPVVLDFGVARLLEAEPGEPAMTRDGHVVGTPGYMSPEQLDGVTAAIDVRADVYALGVIAYQLLGGRLPHDLKGLSLTAACAAVEREPAPLDAVAPRCAGDLATVVHMALRPRKEDRYASAAAFGRDLECVLQRLPVSAHPATAWYHARRFAQRNPVLVGGALAVLVVLAAGIVATSWQARRANEQTELAQAQTRHAHAARDFMQEVLIQVAPGEGGTGRDLEEALAIALRRLQQHRGADPLIEAAVRHTHGRILMARGRYAEARDELQNALAAFRATPLGRGEVPWVLAHLSEAHLRLGDYDEAARCIEAALDAAPAAGADMLLATAANNLGIAHFKRGAIEQAAASFRQAIALYDTVGGDQGAVNAAIGRGNLARLLLDTDASAGAAELLAQAIPALERLLGGDSPQLASALVTRAQLREQGDQLESARADLTEALRIRIGAVGEDGGLAALTAVQLHRLEGRLGIEGAGAAAAAALARATAAFGPQHPEVAKARRLLGQ